MYSNMDSGMQSLLAIASFSDSCFRKRISFQATKQDDGGEKKVFRTEKSI